MHEPFFTSHFGRKEKKLTKKNTELKGRIEEAISEVCNAPKKSKLLKGEFEGKRSYNFGNYRIVFAICGECRRRGFVRFNRCLDCNEKPINLLYSSIQDIESACTSRQKGVLCLSMLFT